MTSNLSLRWYCARMPVLVDFSSLDSVNSPTTPAGVGLPQESRTVRPCPGNAPAGFSLGRSLLSNVTLMGPPAEDDEMSDQACPADKRRLVKVEGRRSPRQKICKRRSPLQPLSSNVNHSPGVANTKLICSRSRIVCS